MTAMAMAPRPGVAAGPGIPLTRRGWAVLAVLVGFLLVGAFRVGAATADERYVPTQPVVVTSGDTLWSIAAEASGPGEDVQAMVVRLQQLNQLRGSQLRVGDVLEVPRR